jgi:hypothetical protein
MTNPPVIQPVLPTPPAIPTPVGTDPEVIRQINALSARLAEQDGLIKNVVAANLAMKTTQVATLINEVKASGIEKPEVMIADLPVDAQIRMLASVKEALATKSPLGQPGGSQAAALTGADKVAADTRDILKSFGMSEKEYKLLVES